MVRLQPPDAVDTQFDLCIFNPTMVRLQQLQRHNEYRQQYSFQSHYGAIATTVVGVATQDGYWFSIPLWCDCNP